MHSQYLLDQAAAFANATSERPGPSHASPFLLICERFNGVYLTSLMELLLNRGASLLERDLFGRTCLHVSIISVLAHDNFDPVQDRDKILLLVKCGADIRAKDNLGMTASHFAMQSPDRTPWSETYKNDLWDAILAISGLDITEFGGNPARPGRYRGQYTKDHFRRLWTGYEAVCPYPERLYYSSDDSESDTEEKVWDYDTEETMIGPEDEVSDISDSDECMVQAWPTQKGNDWQTSTENGEDSADESSESSEDSNDEQEVQWLCEDPNCDFCCRRRWSGRGPRMAFSEIKDTSGFFGARSRRNSLSSDLDNTDVWPRDGQSQDVRKESASDVVGEGEGASGDSLDQCSQGIEPSAIGRSPVEESGQWPVGHSSPVWSQLEFENPWMEE